MTDHRAARHRAPPRCAAPRATPATRSSAASRPAWPATSACPCCGCGRRSWSRRSSAAAAILFYAGLWLVLPAESPLRARGARARERRPAGPPPGPDPPARRLRPGDRAGGARPRHGADRRGDLRQRRRVLAAGARRARLRPAVAAGRRGAAGALARPVREAQPGPRRVRRRRLGGVRPGRRRASSWSSSRRGAVRRPPRPRARRVPTC